MNRIESPMRVGEPSPTTSTSKMENFINGEQNIRKRVAKTMSGYGGIAVSAFLCLITIMVVTTDVSISIRSAAELSVDFFVLFFCAYASYILCSDSGMKAGKSSQLYIDTIKTFEETKQGIIKNKTHCILGEFCKDYIATELKNAKTYYLVAAGIDYDEYVNKYATLEAKDIEALSGLSTAQKKAIMSANAVKPIKLSPERITRNGGVNIRTSPLSISPEARRGVSYSVKFVTSMAIAIGMSYILLNELSEPSWATFVLVCVKSSTVLYNCFSGYKCGYENIVIHSVHFMQEQISLMQQADIFAERYNNNDSTSQHISADSIGVGSDNCESQLHG